MPIHVALNSIYLPKTEGMVLQNAHSRFGLNEELWSHSLSKIERGGQHYEQTSHDGAMAAPTEHQARGVRRISSEVATRRTFWGDKAVILLIRFLKAERNVGQGVLQDSYGRMGNMGLNPDIERLSYRSHCLFSLPPLPGVLNYIRHTGLKTRAGYHRCDAATAVRTSSRSARFERVPTANRQALSLRASRAPALRGFLGGLYITVTQFLSLVLGNHARSASRNLP